MRNVFKSILQRMRPKRPKSPTQDTLTRQQGMIHNRIARYAYDNPKAVEYVLNTEEEAAELLSAMCAILDLMGKEKDQPPTDRKKYLSESRRLKGIMHRREALKYIGNNNMQTCGLTLVGLCEVE